MSQQQLWIVHRGNRERAALARLAPVVDAAVGPPGDARFDSAPPADVVVLGLAGDWEEELQFAHRQHDRLAGARWVLVGDPAQAEAARELFDRLPVEFLAYPPRPEVLRRLTGPRPGARRPALSERAQREQVAARFSRWFGDLELPELMRALDPRLADVPLLVRGEPGSGRELVIRYAHHFGGTAGGGLAHVPCAADTGVAEIGRAVAEASRAPLPSLCVWLDELGRLTPRAQRELAAWLEAGPPPGVRVPLLRWLASLDERGPVLEPELARGLGTLELRLPPLRERAGAIEAVAGAVAAAWARARREAPRRFAPDALALLREYPWPGNLRELEAVVEQSLALATGEELGADDLVLDGVALAPLDATEVGTLLADDEAADEPVLEAEPVAFGEPGTVTFGEPEPVVLGEPEPVVLGEPEPEVVAQPEPGEAAAGAGPWVPSLIPEDEPEPPRPLAREPRPRSAPHLDDGLRRLATTLSSQVRNPLATIRTFAELVPERFDDPDFRARFAEMVRDDVGRIDGLFGRIEQLAALDAPQRQKVDVSALLEGLLDERRESFRRRHLLVLKELDSRQSLVMADPDQLRLAFETLIDRTLELVPERGDVYLASRHHAGSRDDESTVRVLVRFHDPHAGSGPLEQSLELLVTELLVRAQGGRFTLGASEAEERVVVVDLPAV